MQEFNASNLPFCMHNNTRNRNIGNKKLKWERPGSIHHVSGRKVDVGGKGPIFKYVCTKLESVFPTVE